MYVIRARWSHYIVRQFTNVQKDKIDKLLNELEEEFTSEKGFFYEPYVPGKPGLYEGERFEVTKLCIDVLEPYVKPDEDNSEVKHRIVDCLNWHRDSVQKTT